MSCGFVVENGVGRLIDKDYGVMHDVFVAQILIYFVLGFGAMLYSYWMKNNVSNRIILLLFITEVLCVVAFFGGRQLTTQIELLPAAYVIAQVIYLIMGKHFDPALKRYYVAARPRLEEYYRSQGDGGGTASPAVTCDVRTV